MNFDRCASSALTSLIVFLKEKAHRFVVLPLPKKLLSFSGTPDRSLHPPQAAVVLCAPGYTRRLQELLKK